MVREQGSGKNIDRLVKELEAGKRFSEALNQVDFPEYFISLIRIAEERGDYALGLRQCAEFYQSQAKFRRELGQALFYPIIVMLLVILAIFFFLQSVLPQFLSFYEQMAIELPHSTQVFLSMVVILKGFMLTAFLLSILLLIGLRLAKRHESLSILYSFPFVRWYYQRRWSQFFCFQLGILLKSGITLVPSLETIERWVPWITLRRAIRRMKRQILQGATLSQAMVNMEKRCFPPSAASFLKVAEQMGKLDEYLLRYADFSAKELKHRVEYCLQRLEPGFLILAGLFIGVTILAIFLPLFQLIPKL
jgi:type II secretory pathway component PulF